MGTIARGTFEPPGIGFVGEAFVDSLRTLAGGKSVDVYPVNYPASLDFATAADGSRAAVAAQRAVAEHRWPRGLKAAISVALHRGESDGFDAALERCAELCDAAEGGQVFLSPATAGALTDEELGELPVRDLGEQRTRRNGRSVPAYELVVP